MTLNFSSAAASQMYQSVTVPNGATFSVYARARTLTSFALRLSNDGDSPAFTLTNAWRRFSFVSTTALNANISIESTGIAGSIDIAMPQLEAGFATSYIPTTTVSVTRAQDVCYIPTSTWYNPTTMSMAAEIIPPTNSNATLFMGVSDGNFGNSLYAVPQASVICSITGGANLFIGTPVINAVNKAAINYGPGFARGVVNGGVVASAAITSGPVSGATRLSIGCSPWGLDSPFSGWMRRITYWPRVLSNAEMQSVTT
jgi:hypothetical protein